jgi:N-acetylglucosaminyldiphosphoundecaprenol N-acetyl-beta-D-mannosaminyltransferase
VQSETLAEAVSRIDARVAQGDSLTHVVINASKVSKMATDAAFADLMSRFDLVHADGASIVFASRLLGTRLPERVAGIDLMEALLGLAERRGYRVYFLGAKQDVLDRALESIRRDHPDLKIAGYRHGYWGADQDSELQIVEEVRNARADLLFVGIPTPKKEYFIIEHKERLNVRFVMGVGGSIDVRAGVVRRAPVAWQRYGLEWLYRTSQEPRRLWRRYAVTNTHFLWLVFREWLAKRRHRV